MRRRRKGRRRSILITASSSLEEKKTHSFVSVCGFNWPEPLGSVPTLVTLVTSPPAAKRFAARGRVFQLDLLVSTRVGEIKRELVGRLQKQPAVHPRTVKVNQPHPVFLLPE